MKDKKKVLRDLYVLGYEVGYYGHLDTVGWVRKEKERLIEEGIKLGISGDSLIEIFERGVLKGRKEREKRLAFLLGKEFLERVEKEIEKEKGPLYQMRLAKTQGLLKAPGMVYGSAGVLRPISTIKPPTFLYYLPKVYRRKAKRQ